MEVTTGELRREASAKEMAVPCPVCEGTVFDVLLEPEEVEDERRWLHEFYEKRSSGDLKDHADFTQHEATFVVACRRCGTVLRNPQPTPAELDRRYRSDHYGKRTLQQLLESEREFFRAKAARFSLPKGARVLEVGSFVGAFLLAAREIGWSPLGLDIGEETCGFCSQMGLEVFEGELSEVNGSFDAVFIWNTFDQLPKPRETLRQISDLLQPGGLLLLRVPNGEFEKHALDYRRASPAATDRVMAAMAYNNFITFPYLTGYTPASITEMLRQEGFAVEEILGDTILPLANDSTPAFAVREEQLYKRAVMRACALTDGEPTHPWIDVVARRESGKA